MNLFSFQKINSVIFLGNEDKMVRTVYHPNNQMALLLPFWNQFVLFNMLKEYSSA